MEKTTRAGAIIRSPIWSSTNCTSARFTQAGTYLAAIDKLDHIAALGATAIEIMPLADFPGRWNWGYDGVMLYAPTRAYGTPDDLRALVDAAHGKGLSVVLDAVLQSPRPGRQLPRRIQQGLL